jgi:isopenicillin N synthase-like dioxygenase
MDFIPKLDLSDFTIGNSDKKLQFVKELGRAYEEIGFVAIRNHGIEKTTLDNLYKQVSLFFNLPESIKNLYNDDLGGGQRGYTGFGKEHAKNRNTGDLKEFWHFGQFTEDSNDPVNTPSYPKNKYVAELPKFNDYGKLAYKALENTGIAMLRAISLYLGLEENYFDKKVIWGNSILRAIHYPAISEDPKDAIRAGEHEDINLITLLVGASADGLEVLNKQGNYIAVTEVENHIVVNVGDMLQRLTNDVLRSTTHRVVNPPKEKWSEPRFSIPFFLHPRPETRLDCLPNCISELNPKKYDDCSAQEFLTQRLREIGLIK